MYGVTVNSEFTTLALYQPVMSIYLKYSVNFLNKASLLMFSYIVRWKRWREMLSENRSQESAAKTVVQHVSQRQFHQNEVKTISYKWILQQLWNNTSFD